MSLKDLRVTETKPKGVLMSIEGLQKSGKTDFGLSMPGSLFILNLNWLRELPNEVIVSPTATWHRLAELRKA